MSDVDLEPDGWMDTEQYATVFRSLLDAEPGVDRFAVRFFCPYSKAHKFDDDAFITREGTITQLGTSAIEFEDDGTPSYKASAIVFFETDAGAEYKAHLPVGPTPVVYRRQRTSGTRQTWVRNSRAVSDAAVIDGGDDDV